MARISKDRIFNTDIIKRATAQLDDFNKKRMPTASSLVDIANTGNTSARNAKIDKQITGYTKGLKSATLQTVDQNVSAMALRTMTDEARRLASLGIKVKGDDVIAFADAFSKGFVDTKFMGKSLKNRVTNIANTVEKDMTSSVRAMRSRAGNEKGMAEQANRIIGVEKGTVRGVYQKGEVYQTFSATRSSQRLIVSEVARSRREAVEELGRQIGAQYVRVIPFGGKGTCSHCIAIAMATLYTERDLGGQDPKGVYQIGEVPHTHPFCRCRYELVPVLGGDLAYFAQGNVDDFLAMFGGEGISADVATEYMSDFIGARAEMDELLDIPSEISALRNKEFAEALEEKSIQGLQGTDRVFYNNVFKGQEQAINDLVQAMGKSIDPELLKILGPENTIRALTADLKVTDYPDILAKFKANISLRVDESLTEVAARIDVAKHYKGLMNAQEKASTKEMFRLNMSNELKKARREAGQTLGYVDGQERVMRNLVAPDNRMVIRFSDKEKLNKFLKAYPNTRYTVVQGQNAIMVDARLTNFVKPVFEDTAEMNRLLAIKRGAENTGSKEFGYHPKGTNNSFYLSAKQESAVRFMKESGQVILNSAPGTGKTPMAIATVQELIVEGKIQKNVLVVTKNRLTGQFADEWKKFVGNMNEGAAETAAGRKALYADNSRQIKIISHQGFVNDVAAGLLNPADFDATIIDEFQLLGDGGKRVLQKFNTQYKYALSGTPVQDNIGEMWGMVKWVNPKLFKAKSEFVSLFSSAAQNTTFFNDAVYREINNKLGANLITRKQEAIKPYKKNLKFMKVSGSAQEDLQKLEATYLNPRTGMERKIKIRKQMQDIVDGPLSQKSQALKDIMDVHARQKKIIFVKNQAQAEMMEKLLVKQGTDKGLIYKMTSQTGNPDEVKELFRVGGKPSVMIMDATASVGHDLPQAKVVIHWTPPPNASAWLQRTARAWRIGNKETTVYDMMTQSLEDSMRFGNIKKTQGVFNAFQNAESVDDSGLLSILSQERRR